MFLELHNLSVRYGGVYALHHVSLTIHEKEILVLIGPNGAGKSTILKALFGITPYDEGEIFWQGELMHPLSHEMVRRGMTFVPQGRRVFSSLSVEENIEMGGFHVSRKKELERRKQELFNFFPILFEKRHMPAGTLSGGQQQMLAIARGLMPQPRILMLDEPSLGLTPKLVKEIFKKLYDIHTFFGTTLVIVEHNIKTLLPLVHRVCVLQNGRIAAQGTPEELQRSSVIEKIFLGTE